MPMPKTDPEAVRILTWNILHGAEHGALWKRFGWPVRKEALRSALQGTRPDILCVQEALAGQVESIAEMLPGYGRVGVGRDDGRSAGEYCAIYFDGGRFQKLDSGTFWLEEPCDEPPRTTILGPKRICTYIRLRDRLSDRTLRIYNTHLYLRESARLRATRLILERIAAGEPGDAVLVAGDFNAGPDAPSRRLFDQAGIESSGTLSGQPASMPTYHFYGIRFRSFDEILVTRAWIVRQHRVLDVKPGNTFPSDHFGVLAELLLRS
jgi:endonuclease/exonuclease/phosphatase family metal-dependent hydrolase